MTDEIMQGTLLEIEAACLEGHMGSRALFLAEQIIAKKWKNMAEE